MKAPKVHSMPTEPDALNLSAKMIRKENAQMRLKTIKVCNLCGAKQTSRHVFPSRVVRYAYECGAMLHKPYPELRDYNQAGYCKDYKGQRLN